MRRADLVPNTVYLVESTGTGSASARHSSRTYAQTGDPLEVTENWRHERLVIFHPVDTSGDPHRDDEWPGRSTVITWETTKKVHPRAVFAPVCSVIDWPAQLAKLVAEREVRDAEQARLDAGKRTDLTRAVAGLRMAGIDVHADPWKRYLTYSLAKERPPIRSWVAYCLLNANEGDDEEVGRHLRLAAAHVDKLQL